VPNHAGNSVTELNTSDGSWVRTLSGGSYGFSCPNSIAFDGSHLWVPNTNNCPYYASSSFSLTELNASDGSWVQTISGETFSFYEPSSVAYEGGHVWVTNCGANKESVTELNASDGSWMRTLSSAPYGFGCDTWNAWKAIAFDGSHIWVANPLENSVTEVSAH
jgi:hypothetical protein